MSTNRAVARITLVAIVGMSVLTSGQTSSTSPGNPWPPKRPAVEGKAPVLTPAEALDSFSVPPGFRVELVAAEPMIESPIIIEFDPDGRLWAIEMPAFLPDLSGRDSPDPINRVVVLEDTDDDGRMDKRTVFADQARTAARAEGARSRRADRRAAESLADEGYERRPEGRHEGSRLEHFRHRGTEHRAQRQQRCSGRWTTSCTRPSTPGTCA